MHLADFFWTCKLRGSIATLTLKVNEMRQPDDSIFLFIDCKKEIRYYPLHQVAGFLTG